MIAARPMLFASMAAIWASWLTIPGEAGGDPAHRRSPHPALPRQSGPPRAGHPSTGGDDALYRERGYGIGGVPFTLGGQGGLAPSGACAQVADRNPACGPSGYGIYGNGVGYGFGSP